MKPWVLLSLQSTTKNIQLKSEPRCKLEHRVGKYSVCSWYKHLTGCVQLHKCIQRAEGSHSCRLPWDGVSPGFSQLSGYTCLQPEMLGYRHKQLCYSHLLTWYMVEEENSRKYILAHQLRTVSDCFMNGFHAKRFWIMKDTHEWFSCPLITDHSPNLYLGVFKPMPLSLTSVWSCLAHQVKTDFIL